MPYPSPETIRDNWRTHAESKSMSGDDAARAQADYVPTSEFAAFVRDEFPSIVTVLPDAELNDPPSQDGWLKSAMLSDCPRVDETAISELDAVRKAVDQAWEETNRTSETILNEAARITSRDRNKSYGPPRDNHSRTAALWSAYLGIPLTYRDVCWMNVLQKASRDRHCPHRDSLVDGCGFLRNIEMADNDEGR
jgi:hypothetical protein